MTEKFLLRDQRKRNTTYDEQYTFSSADTYKFKKDYVNDTSTVSTQVSGETYKLNQIFDKAKISADGTINIYINDMTNKFLLLKDGYIEITESINKIKIDGTGTFNAKMFLTKSQ